MKVAYSLGILAVVAAGAAAQPLRDRRAEALITAVATPAGAFRRYCAPCHGADGRGGGSFWPSELTPAPPNLREPRRSAERFREVLLQGTRGPYGCPPLGSALSAPMRERLIHAWTSTQPPPPTTASGGAPPAGGGRTVPWIVALVAELLFFLWLRYGARN